MPEENKQVTPESVAFDATVIAPTYDKAVENRDVGALKQAAKDNIDNPASGAFLRAAKIIERNQQEFQNLVAPIDQKGGTATPEGRLQIVSQFETTADRPQWGTALLKYVMGDKAGAVKQITGGDIKTKITYDNDGNQIEEKFNELGEPLSYFDRNNNKFISKEEYAKRAGGISSWANTLYGQTEAKRREQNLATSQKESAQTNHWLAMTQNHFGLARQSMDILNKMKSDLPPELYNKIIESTTSSVGTATSKSKSESILKQLSEAASQGDGFKLSDTLAGELGGRGKILQIKGDRVVSTDGTFNESISSLRNRQSTESMNAEATNNAAKTRDSIMAAVRLGKLDETAANQLLFVIDASQRIGKETADAIEKFGRPSFISPPSTSSIVDKQSQMMAQSLQLMHNAEQMMVYKNYRDKAMQGYQQVNQLPTAGEIDAAYTRTPGFRELQGAYANDIGAVLSQSFSKQQKPEAKPAAGPVAPKSTPAQGGKPPRRSLSAIAGE